VSRQRWRALAAGDPYFSGAVARGDAGDRKRGSVRHVRGVLSGEESGTESDRVDSGRFDEDREGDSNVSVREVQGRERGARAPPHVRARLGGVGREEERLESD